MWYVNGAVGNCTTFAKGNNATVGLVRSPVIAVTPSRGALPDAAHQPFEILPFGEAQQDGMVWGLGMALNHLYIALGID